MGAIKNKAELLDRYKAGDTGKAKSRTGWYKHQENGVETKDPLHFANSSQLSKMKRKR